MIDAHVHLWNVDQLHYPWIDGIDALNRNFLLKDYQQATKKRNIDKIIFVQCDCLEQQSLDEVDMISALAQEDKRIEAIIAFAPLEKKIIDDYLKKLQQFPLVKGIRCLAQNKKLGFSATQEIITGTKKLVPYNLTSDISIKQEQIEDVLVLVKNCPDNTFILDHIAKPNIATGNTEKWFKDLEKLATYENVFCKISGILTEAGKNWSIKQIKPYILHTITCFGEDRIMFGSDWPVVNLVGSYESWYKSLEEILCETSINRDKFFVTNAKKIYNLN